MVHLYLVQHGEAASKAVDPDRPLTERGRADTRDVADFASHLELEVAQIRHSGKTRAAQTATLFEETLAPATASKATSGLAPNDDVAPVAEALGCATESIMLVGHLPFLERLTGVLVCGDPECAPVRFRNAAVVCLTREAQAWQVAWILTPEMARTDPRR